MYRFFFPNMKNHNYSHCCTRSKAWDADSRWVYNELIRYATILPLISGEDYILIHCLQTILEYAMLQYQWLFVILNAYKAVKHQFLKLTYQMLNFWVTSNKGHIIATYHVFP